MNIVYIDPIVNTSYSYQYHYYNGLFNALSEQHNVKLVSKCPLDIKWVIEPDTDVVCFGIGFFARNDFPDINNTDSINIPIVAMIHKEKTEIPKKLDFCKINNVSLILNSQKNYIEYGELTGIPSQRVCFASSSEKFNGQPIEKKYDIGFTGANHRGKTEGISKDIRVRIKELIEKENINAFWKNDLVGINEYIEAMNKTKVWLSTTGPIEDVGTRYFEVAMTGSSLLFCNEMPDSYEDMFIDGYNCVTFKNDLSDFKEKLDYYLEHDDERQKIIDTAREDALEKHTWKSRADKFITAVKGV